MTQQPADEFLCTVCNPSVLRKVVSVDEQGGVTLECGHRQIMRTMNEPPTHVSDRMSAMWPTTHEDRDKIVFILTLSVCAGVFILGGYRFLSYLQDTFRLDSLTVLGVIIAACVALSGAYSYMKSRLDKLISQLDKVRTWLLYPSVRTKPLRAYTEFDDLQGIARCTVDKLAEAQAAMAGRLIISGPIPLMIKNVKGNVDVGTEIDNTITLLNAFYVAQFTSAEELTKQWKTIVDKTEWLYFAVTDLEARYYKMRNWLPRWLINQYGKIRDWLRAKLGKRAS